MKKAFLATAAILFLMSTTIVSCKPKAHCQAYGKVNKVVSKNEKPA